jgi:hypothetical protein
MWLTTFTTQRGNICIRFGSKVLNVQACAAGKPLVELLKRYPRSASVAGIVLPLLLQIYLASRKTKK